MNFLAHLVLSDPTPAAWVGNILADFVKGPDVAALPADVLAGVVFHRKIDGFTDRHPAFQRSVTRIAANWGWFSGIVIDIYYDHLLARDFPTFAGEDLRTFADRVYPALRAGARHMPARDEHFFEKFAADDRLASYATVAGITAALARVSGVIAARMPKRARPLEDAMPELIAADADLAADFREFFPAVTAFARTASDAAAVGLARPAPGG